MDGMAISNEDLMAKIGERIKTIGLSEYLLDSTKDILILKKSSKKLKSAYGELSNLESYLRKNRENVINDFNGSILDNLSIEIELIEKKLGKLLKEFQLKTINATEFSKQLLSIPKIRKKFEEINSKHKKKDAIYSEVAALLLEVFDTPNQVYDFLDKNPNFYPEIKKGLTSPEVIRSRDNRLKGNSKFITS